VFLYNNTREDCKHVALLLDPTVLLYTVLYKLFYTNCFIQTVLYLEALHVKFTAEERSRVLTEKIGDDRRAFLSDALL
jgi:hypothetical protein